MNQNNQQNTISILAFFMQRLFQSASLKRWFMVLLFLGGTATIEARQKPNMIVYLSDDLGYLDVSVYGASVVKTPILQQLSQEGMTFDNAFVASPSCAPSRAALLTGLMPAKNGAEVNHAFPAQIGK